MLRYWLYSFMNVMARMLLSLCTRLRVGFPFQQEALEYCILLATSSSVE